MLDELDAIAAAASSELRSQMMSGQESFLRILRVVGTELYRVQLRLLWDTQVEMINVLGLDLLRQERFDLY